MKRLCVLVPIAALGLALANEARADESGLPGESAPVVAEIPEKKMDSAPDVAPAEGPAHLAPSPMRAATMAPGESERPHDPEEPTTYVPTTPNRWTRYGLGARVGWSSNAGLDPFSRNDTLGQVSIDVSRTLLSRGKLSLALGLAADVGNKSATARGVTSGITMLRVVAPIEGRLHLFSWLYAFAKVAPGVSVLDMSVKDPSAPTTLGDTRPGFALDGSVGASFLVVGHGTADQKRVRLWATPELGYGWTTSSRPTLTTSSREDVLGREEGASLSPIAIRGVFFRLGVGLTY